MEAESPKNRERASRTALPEMLLVSGDTKPFGAPEGTPSGRKSAGILDIVFVVLSAGSVNSLAFRLEVWRRITWR
jgi:hypothetical protein